MSILIIALVKALLRMWNMVLTLPAGTGLSAGRTAIVSLLFFTGISMAKKLFTYLFRGYLYIYVI
ncbi:hypothetical protein CDQ84_00610 [Clostridium thermosuccinogenes]|uniref:Uncharacterized protein n=1 Tax=Clostridium thermosuccinogenes TaxID=84032 RepID=A0A2K2F605_9CLOT|nr:hypothetical protein CDO33_16600 [Pseudoclostridium thermosuccinogenes]PNT94212.1 hypothetical protein CDQ83_12255 [Pseudoclostridium thermosuccinogenes]PNU00219.1 hypothetical protein CDQ85_00610 [Pseudoclostridium thermosuccinogenes]PNU01543.1 hypothetical protein CDQ84_00610 [Pseudoclostridium thermosuccinogenes]